MHLDLTFTKIMYLGSVLSLARVEGKTACVGNYEIQTYDEKVNYNEAKRRCGFTQRYLAKLDSQAMTDALNTLIGGGDIYYIGLRYSSGWKWESDTSAPRYWNKENDAWTVSYLNQRTGYYVYLYCVIAKGSSFGKWTNVECTEEHAFICQRTLQAPVMSVEPNTVTVFTADKYTITCSAQKVTSCAPVVTWQDKSNTVSFDTNSEVHQTRSSTQSQVTSTLVLKNPKISATGSYTCRVFLGSVSNFGQAKIYVQSYPSIQEITAAQCSPNVTIKWIPSSRALGFLHIVKVYAVDDPTDSIEIRNQSYPSNSITLTDLKPSRHYSIEISACRTSACTYGYSKRSTVTTHGIPYQVRSVTMFSDGKNCNVQWKPPNRIVDDITGYTISIEKEFHQSRVSVFNDTEIRSVTNTSYNFKIEPNMQYRVKIRAVTCAGPGDEVSAIGTCIGIPTVPEKVEKPVIEVSDNGTNIKVFIPNENKGLISCIFVMVSLGGEEKSFLEGYTAKKSFDDLITSTILDQNIAIAVPYSKVARNDSFNATLGGGTLSYCNLFETGKPNLTSSRSLIFVGRNKAVANDEQNRPYVVVAVPHKDKVSLRRSEDASLYKPVQYTTKTATTANSPTSQPTDPSTKKEYSSILTTTSASVNEAQSGHLEVIDIKYFGLLALVIPLMIIAWKLGEFKQSKKQQNESETLKQVDPENFDEKGNIHVYEQDLGPSAKEANKHENTRSSGNDQEKEYEVPISRHHVEGHEYEEHNGSCCNKNGCTAGKHKKPTEEHLYHKIVPKSESNLDGDVSGNDDSSEKPAEQSPGRSVEYTEMQPIHSDKVIIASSYENYNNMKV